MKISAPTKQRILGIVGFVVLLITVWGLLVHHSRQSQHQLAAKPAVTITLAQTGYSDQVNDALPTEDASAPQAQVPTSPPPAPITSPAPVPHPSRDLAPSTTDQPGKPELPERYNLPMREPGPTLNSNQFTQVKAWSIQIGAFTNPVHAKAMVKKLRQEGFDIYSKVEKHHGKSFTLVLVGPYIKQQKAKQLAHQLLTQHHLQGVIKKYTL